MKPLIYFIQIQGTVELGITNTFKIGSNQKMVLTYFSKEDKNDWMNDNWSIYRNALQISREELIICNFFRTRYYF